MRITRTIIAMALVVALASCDEELGQVEVATAQLQLSADIASTRAGIHAVSFDSGDAIGVFAYTGQSYRESWNVKATTNSKLWSFEQPVSLFQQSTAVHAYYPWNSNATVSHIYGFTVDATTQTNYMVGCDTVSYSNPKARIAFRHITAKVSFHITKDYPDYELMSATLGGEQLPLSGRYLFDNGFVSLTANATACISSKNIGTLADGRQNAEFLLFPNGNSCSATLDLTYRDGTMYSTEFTLPVIEENCNYAYNVKITGQQMVISSPVIAPWNNPTAMDEIAITHAGGHEYVDLGLSVKWATCNVGAKKPEEHGDYFAWGETSRKTEYGWYNYKYCNGSSSTLTKYCNKSSYGYNGFTDSKTVLDPEDDAAHANWGGSWRMPTKAEQDELRNTDNCTWTWTTLNGVNGYKVVSKKSGYAGNFIFLPAAGYRYAADLYYVGSGGYYWSSSLYTSGPYDAYDLYFDSSFMGWSDYSRNIGQSVRPVCPVPVTDIGLDRQSVEIMQGGTETLTANVQLENGVTVNTATWSSSNTGVAIVDQTGKITAISVGTCTITATNGNCSATCSVTVKAFEPEYVDLGLSVKWATCNVGATAPEDYGDYFAWGETSPKSDYSWSTYKYCKGSSSTLTKYCDNSSYGYNGFTDSKTVLDPADDAARANWGGSWRMPTKAEQDELRNTDNCTWTWTTLNGVNGYKVVSKKSGYAGNWIFLPAAGFRNGTSLSDVGSYGYFWSSSLGPSDPYDAYSLYFGSSDVGWGYYYRYSGRSVRPVCPVPVTGIGLNRQSVEIMEGNTVTLTATVQLENGTTVNSVTWFSSNTGVATVDQTGKITAISAGTCNITASSGSFTATCSVTVKPWEPQYVDLGLSVKWATCNVGATAPEDYGDYFAWGETSSKSGYSWSTYKYCKGSSSTLTKYCDNSSYGYNGFTDSKTVLDPADDAARANWGGSWRMPTKAEQDELRNTDNCTWTWTTLNGVNGYKVVSKKSGYAGNWIFLPAAGYRYDTYLGNVGSYGSYWSSSLYTSYPVNACNLYFYSSTVDWGINYRRLYGQSVRPVFP